MKFRRTHPLLSASLGLFFLPALTGQETETGTAGPVYELSPFVVDTENTRGYQAFSSNSATRLTVELQELPMSVEVLNSEFIEDTGAVNLEEALRYSSGVFSGDVSGAGQAGANEGGSAEFSPSVSGGFNSAFNNSLNIRGFNIPNQQRLGFRVGGNIAEYGVNLGGLLDAQNIERIEVVRGPQALLYGVSVISGVANVIPKKPLSEFRQQYSLSFGDNQFRRAGIDVTGPTNLLDDLDYRVLGSVMSREDWTDFRSTETRYGAFQLRYTPKPRTEFFFEVQLGKERQEGMGRQFLRDSGTAFENATATEAQSIVPFLFPVVFQNEYGELYNWARDAEHPGPEYHSRFNDQYPFGDYGPDYRLTGPDTFFERDEINLLFDANFPLPLEGLDAKVGVFYSNQETESRDVSIATSVYQNNNPNRPADLRTPHEVLFPYGPTEAPDDLSRIDRRRYELNMNANDEWRVARYFWQRGETAAESLQIRADINYEFTTGFPFGESRAARHNLLAGYQYTLDDVDYPVGAPAQAFIDTMGPRDDQSPVRYRSIFDFEPMRYDGSPLAPPGGQFQNTELWYHGIFGVYQGRFFDEKLFLVLGARRDIYNGEDNVYRRPGDIVTTPSGGNRVIPAVFVEDSGGNWVREADGGFAFAPDNGTHRKTYNGENRTDGFLSREEALNTGKNFASDIEEDTFTLALSYQLHPSLNVYAMRAEGISPNTGLKDGNNDFFEAERTTSTELGVKFNFFDSRISGQVAVYRIERENAIWRFLAAPAPGRWTTGSEPAIRGTPPFDPTLSLDKEPGDEGYAPINYPVHSSFFSGEREYAGRLDGFRESGAVESTSTLPDGVYDSQTLFGGTQTYHYVDYNVIANPQTPHEEAMREAVLTALNTPLEGEGIVPIAYGRRGLETNLNNNPSQAGSDINGREGAFVPFEDETTGVDAQLTLQVTDNWQMILSASHLEREATTTFQLLPTVYNGENVGTEFDEWAYALGLDAFADTDYSDGLDPSSHDSGGIKGLSLYFNPETTASLWNKYTFRDGPLEGWSVGGGLMYYGEAQTSVPVGGTNMTENQYRTPDLPSRINVDGFLGYRKVYDNFTLNVRLNVTNLLDDRVTSSVVTYDAPETLAGEQTRRSIVYHAPRSYRVTMNLEF